MKELEIKGTDYKVTTPGRQKAKKVGQINFITLVHL